jgi:hypothetical protein
LRSIKIVEFAGIAVVVNNEIGAPDGPKENVKVAAVPAVLVTAMFVTIAVVEAGTV